MKIVLKVDNLGSFEVPVHRLSADVTGNIHTDKGTLIRMPMCWRFDDLNGNTMAWAESWELDYGNETAVRTERQVSYL